MEHLGTRVKRGLATLDRKTIIDIATIPVYLILVIFSFIIARRNKFTKYKGFTFIITFSLIKIIKAILAIIVTATGTKALETTKKTLSTIALQTLILVILGTINPEPSPKSPALNSGIRANISTLLKALKALVGLSLTSGLLGDFTDTATETGKEISHITELVSAVTICIVFVILGALIWLYWSSKPVFTKFHQRMYPWLALAVMPLLAIRVAYYVAGIVTAPAKDAAKVVATRVFETTTLQTTEPETSIFAEDGGKWELFLGMALVEEVLIITCIVILGWIFVVLVPKRAKRECTCGKCICRRSEEYEEEEGDEEAEEEYEEEMGAEDDGIAMLGLRGKLPASATKPYHPPSSTQPYYHPSSTQIYQAPNQPPPSTKPHQRF